MAYVSSVISIFIMSTLFLFLCLPNNNNNNNIPPTTNNNINLQVNNNYHHMELVLTWVPTFCSVEECNPSAPTDFTMHGLWPADDVGVTLKECPAPEEEIDLSPLFDTLMRPDLEKVWPSVTPKSSQDLWTHEYQSHGICALAQLDADLYFRAAIRADEKLDVGMLESFRRNQIFPSEHTSYTQSQIFGAVKSVMDARDLHIYISCKPDNKTHVHVKLYEIYMCLDQPVANYVTCPRSDPPIFRGCPGKKRILLLPIN